MFLWDNVEVRIICVTIQFVIMSSSIVACKIGWKHYTAWKISKNKPGYGIEKAETRLHQWFPFTTKLNSLEADRKLRRETVLLWIVYFTAMISAQVITALLSHNVSYNNMFITAPHSRRGVVCLLRHSTRESQVILALESSSQLKQLTTCVSFPLIGSFRQIWQRFVEVHVRIKPTIASRPTKAASTFYFPCVFDLLFSSFFQRAFPRKTTVFEEEFPLGNCILQESKFAAQNLCGAYCQE